MADTGDNAPLEQNDAHEPSKEQQLRCSSDSESCQKSCTHMNICSSLCRNMKSTSDFLTANMTHPAIRSNSLGTAPDPPLQAIQSFPTPENSRSIQSVWEENALLRARLQELEQENTNLRYSIWLQERMELSQSQKTCRFYAFTRVVPM